MKNVIITDGGVRIRATLNDTLAARDFEKRLPFTCSGYDSGIDYCCSAANGLYDPLETQVPTQARGIYDIWLWRNMPKIASDVVIAMLTQRGNPRKPPDGCWIRSPDKGFPL